MKANKDESYDSLLAEEALVTEALECLLAAMEQRGLSQADLARRLGVRRAAVSRVFNGSNLTVRTVARFAHAIGVEMRFVVTYVAR